MPKALEKKLKAQAKKKGFGKKRTGAYVYGTLRKTGWSPSKPKRHNWDNMSVNYRGPGAFLKTE